LFNFIRFKIIVFKTEDVKEIAKALSELPKKNAQHPRVVIITQGADPTVLAIGRKIFHWFILEFFVFAYSWKRYSRISS
jgi:hypothetical protein